MTNQNKLPQLSTSGQMLSDIPLDIRKELICVIKIAVLIMTRFSVGWNSALNTSLTIYTIADPNTAVTEVRHQKRTKLFDVVIDKVGREIISLTIEDLKLLARVSIS